ncbi:hypothetical protein HN446_03520 [bacterium]|jgi:hypothetical protein|nr:hypothetical protein [bacterium]
MIIHLKKHFVIYAFLIIAIPTALYLGRRKVVKKDASEVFNKWISNQNVFGDINLELMSKYRTKKNIANLSKIDPIEHDKALIQHLSQPSIYSQLETDMTGFIQALMNSSFAEEKTNEKEKAVHFKQVTKKYNGLFYTLFDTEDTKLQKQFLFSLANHFFEFCFYPKTYPIFKSLLENDKYHPIARMLYTIMRTDLAKKGWHAWSKECLKDLKRESSNNKEIVYIAGGSDVYQLLINDIYNIRIIDPQLPSQRTYYCKDWEFLIDGQNGDTISVPIKSENKTLILKRTSQEIKDSHFTAALTGKGKVQIPESNTEWTIYDTQNPNKTLGKITFERRFVSQKDFVFDPQKALLISFNELFYIATPYRKDSWGINPKWFDQNLVLYVKQLRGPIYKKTTCNLKYAIESRAFRFVNLGSNVY